MLESAQRGFFIPDATKNSVKGELKVTNMGIKRNLLLFFGACLTKIFEMYANGIGIDLTILP